MTTAFKPGQSWRFCSQATSWMTVVVLRFDAAVIAVDRLVLADRWYP